MQVVQKSKINNLKQKAALLRKSLLDMIVFAKSGHTGGSLSSIDILTVLYYHVLNIRPKEPDWEERDRFIMSKGHSVEGLYSVLADKGFFPKEELKTFSAYGSRLIGHPSVKVPGVEVNTGALGHGLSFAAGIALAAKKRKSKLGVYCLMGDGELAEGSVWEAAMAASNFELDNITGIVDRNRLQISGNTEDVMRLENLQEKWSSFGWDVHIINGHDIEAIINILEEKHRSGVPKLVIAETTKGKGVTFMENKANWHHGVPNEEQYNQAINEINQYLERIQDEV